jgi:diguanylate cyclase (GGDEF)-like protein
MKEELLAQIRQCPNLPSLPAIAMEVLGLAQSDEVDLGEIARIISKDAALSSKILRTVNSSFYGRSQSVSQVSHALVILGLQSVKTLVLGFSLVGNLQKQKSKGFNHLDYWRRSIYAATAAKTLAARTQMVQAEECFLAALLQDIGMLVLNQVLQESYGAITAKAATHRELEALERTALEGTHAEVTGFLADEWKLPPLLATPMRNHHDPQSVEDAQLRKLADVGYVAGLCADVFVDADANPALSEVRTFCMDRFKMPEAECDAMLSEIGKRTKEIAPLFEIKLERESDFEDVLKKANEALVELTLRTQQQAVNLEQQNQRLKEQVTTDALTGLASRGRFEQFLNEQFGSALAQRRPLSLLMMDLDKFKAVNDAHGHPVGDQVLQAVGKLLRTAARATDLAARYGGEELVLVLPGTGKATAAAIAESIRRAVAAKPVKGVAKQAVQVTISIGVATLEADSPLKEAAHLLKAADLAVYAAKHAGRNCVKVFSLPGGGAVKSSPKAAVAGNAPAATAPAAPVATAQAPAA